jgi:hypothetical protein
MQPVARGRHEQRRIGFPTDGQRPHNRQDPISHRNPPGPARLRALYSNALRFGTLHYQHRHRNLHKVPNPDRPQLGPPEPRPSVHKQDVGQPLITLDRLGVHALKISLAEREHLGFGADDFGTRLANTGLATIMRSRTPQAKKDDSESRNRCTEEVARPDRDSDTNARVTSRSVTAPTDNPPRKVGTRRGRAASAM